MNSALFYFESNSCKQQADIGGGNGEEQAIHSVKCAAVAGDKIAEILNADHSLKQGFSQIAYLT